MEEICLLLVPHSFRRRVELVGSAVLGEEQAQTAPGPTNWGAGFGIDWSGRVAESWEYRTADSGPKRAMVDLLGRDWSHSQDLA